MYTYAHYVRKCNTATLSKPCGIHLYVSSFCKHMADSCKQLKVGKESAISFCLS